MKKEIICKTDNYINCYCDNTQFRLSKVKTNKSMIVLKWFIHLFQAVQIISFCNWYDKLFIFGIIPDSDLIIVMSSLDLYMNSCFLQT